MSFRHRFLSFCRPALVRILESEREVPTPRREARVGLGGDQSAPAGAPWVPHYGGTFRTSPKGVNLVSLACLVHAATDACRTGILPFFPSEVSCLRLLLNAKPNAKPPVCRTWSWERIIVDTPLKNTGHLFNCASPSPTAPPSF